MATTEVAAARTPTPAAAVQYRGVAMLPDGKWRAYIVNRDGQSFDLGEFGTATAAALAHDRAILSVLGSSTSAAVLNFRAAFSDTELRFLRGRHAPARPAGVVAMVRLSGDGSYDTELSQFAARAFDAYMDPELAFDVATFRLAHNDVLHRLKEKAAIAAGTNANQATRDKAMMDAEREAFVQATKNKATDEVWVDSYHRRRQQIGHIFEDENRWPLVLPVTDVHVDWSPGEELIYLPHGSSHIDEMIMGNSMIKKS
ncbi:hypothetical protein BAE44_0025518 [Dichanthelium oligosanthes]|uniref:AP2/ERF domain-containing protein n=1 Tax=Dichanthelium oligosanthes TaxID=888268 RepID=A0A1E5UKQ2_9POAL|nr:hypothetical protein BAE44_0025518 [Dichanthelium oligosanthes]